MRRQPKAADSRWLDFLRRRRWAILIVLLAGIAIVRSDVLDYFQLGGGDDGINEKTCNLIHSGMTRGQVKALLGEPTDTMYDGSRLEWAGRNGTITVVFDEKTREVEFARFTSTRYPRGPFRRPL